MANQEHLDMLYRGVDDWNRWRQKYVNIEPDLNEANLSKLHLGGADLRKVHLRKANLHETHLEGADLYQAHLEGADLSKAYLEEAILSVAHLRGADLREAHLKGTKLNGAHLEKTLLNEAHLEEAILNGAHLEEASLNKAHLEEASLNKAHLAGADLGEAFFSNTTRLNDVTLSDEEYGAVSLADVRWGSVNLAVVGDWTSVKKLGDERTARQTRTLNGGEKYQATRIDEYRAAVRANRQLAVVLRNQGLNEEADHFAYRAQVLQKTVFRFQMLEQRVTRRRRIRMFLSWLFSWFLYLIAGYGYRPLNSIIAYVLLILSFAVAFYTLGDLKCYEALVVSLTAFHGRGFFAQEYKPGDLHSVIAAIEAVVGLLVEISFIATFTQRFFGR